MNKEKSFKSLLEALLRESEASSEEPIKVFTSSSMLGEWADEISLKFAPSRRHEGLKSYRFFHLESDSFQREKEDVNTASKKAIFPEKFDWKDELMTAKMIFNTYSDYQINESSSEILLKKAYRALLFDVHPDQNHKDEKAAERFFQVQRAYKVLKMAIKT